MFSQRHQRRPRHGATVVEMAVVLGLAFLILMAILEYGRYLMVRHLVDNAAREGARYAAVSTNNPNTSLITTRVQNYLAGKVPGANITCYWCNPSTGSSLGNWHEAPYGAGIAVQVSHTYTPMVPTFGVLPNPMTITSISVMRSEDNR